MENKAGKIKFAKLSFYRVLPTSIYSQEMRKYHKTHPFSLKKAASLLGGGEEKILFISCLIVDPTVATSRYRGIVANPYL